MKPRFRFNVADIANIPGFEKVERRNFEVLYPSTLGAPRDQSVIFVKECPPAGIGSLAEVRDCIVLVPEGQTAPFAMLLERNLVIPVRSPRLEFARVIGYALSKQELSTTYCTMPDGAILGDNVTLGEGVVIEPQSFIDHDVEIGDHSRVCSGSRIRPFTQIGRETLLRENSVIGGLGFGFARDENEIPVRLPHLGGVVIGDRVEVGALSTVVCGTIDPTIVEDDVKIDDHVHIGHNVTVRRGSIITACTVLCGRVEVGAYSWVGPNSSVIQGITLGDHCFVGLGTVVTKDVPPGATVAGNPAEPIADLKAMREARSRMLQAFKENKI